LIVFQFFSGSGGSAAGTVMRTSNGGGADAGGEVLLDHEYQEVGLDQIGNLRLVVV
jgi:hypothetical protein